MLIIKCSQKKRYREKNCQPLPIRKQKLGCTVHNFVNK